MRIRHRIMSALRSEPVDDAVEGGADPGLDDWVVVCSADELDKRRRMQVQLPGGESIVVLATRNGPVAFLDRCPHLGRRLVDCDLKGDRIRCQGHGREYALRAGSTSGRHRSSQQLGLLETATVGGRVFVVAPPPA
jgi:nitrite reductase/ring-hydroxylating ferredoxin subunit